MKLLSVEEVAETLGVSRQTVSRMIAEGALPALCLRSGRRKKVWRVRAELLDRWILGKERESAKHVSKSNHNGKEEHDQLTNCAETR
jgi:excisionase family DNA binding protein